MPKNSALEEKRLPLEEWDFSSLKTNQQITNAFFYEFMRSCPQRCSNILWARRTFGYDFLWTGQEGTYNQLNKRDKEKADSKVSEIERSELHNVMELLTGIRDFPEKPFLGISTRDEEGNPVLYSHFSSTSHLSADLRAFSMSSYSIPKGPRDALLLNSEKKDIQHWLDNMKEEKSFLACVVDWRCSDAEIIVGFSEMLKVFRPEKFTKVCPKDSLGLNGIPLPIPYGKKTALKYLGVWRRSQNCSWKEFLELYPGSTACSTFESARRSLIEQRNKAEELLNWFENI